MEDSFDFSAIRALILDMDGTLYHGDQPAPGLTSFFSFLQAEGIAHIVATNATVRTPAFYRQRFARWGVTVEPEQIVTAATATAGYIDRVYGANASVYMIGEIGLRTALVDSGFALLDDASQPADIVVVGGDTALTYDKLKYGVLHLQRGATLVATNPDLLVPSAEGLIPEAGTILAALAAATGVRPTIVGKPEPLIFEIAVAVLAQPIEQTAIVGDRLETDILGGQCAGLHTILITTGVNQESDVQKTGIRPDVIVPGLTELTALWRRTRQG